MGDGSQSEGQKPAFRVENGATLKNVILGKNGVDGVHFYNGATLDNFRWTDVGEDAWTVKKAGTVYIRNVSGYDAADKWGQVNDASTIEISNCIVHRAGKAIRQNGGTDFKIVVKMDKCDIADMKEGVFRTDSSKSEAYLSNSRLHNAGTICIGPWAKCSLSNNTTY
jgi:pectate lyase C